MKKITTLLLVLVLMVALVACGANAPAETTGTPAPETTQGVVQETTGAPAEETTDINCEHQWQEAACYNPKTCSICGATEGGPVHKYELTELQEASCTETGVEQYYCQICDDPHMETVPAIGHDVVNGVCILCKEQIEE